MNGPGSCYEGRSCRRIAVQYGCLAFRSRSFIRNVWRFRWHRTGNAKHLIDLGYYMVKFRAAPQLRHAREGQLENRRGHKLRNYHDHGPGRDAARTNRTERARAARRGGAEAGRRGAPELTALGIAGL